MLKKITIVLVETKQNEDPQQKNTRKKENI